MGEIIKLGKSKITGDLFHENNKQQGYYDGKNYKDCTIEEMVELCNSGNLSILDAVANNTVTIFEKDPTDQNKEMAMMVNMMGLDWNSPCCIGNMAAAYYAGSFVEHDLAEALKYAKMGAKYGNPVSLLILGYLYDDGIIVEKDIQQAFFYYQKCAEFDEYHVLAEFPLAQRYFNGYGTEKNYDKAFYHLKNCENNLSFLSDVYYMLGECYYYGYGTPKKTKKAIEYLSKREVQNNPNALHLIAYIYANGVPKRVKKDFRKTLCYLKRYCFIQHVDINEVAKSISLEFYNWYRKTIKKEV